MLNTPHKLSIIAVSIVSFFLIGCEKTIQPVEPTVQLEPTLSKPISAQQVTFETRTFDYQIPQAVSDLCSNNEQNNIAECPDFDIKLAVVEPKWIETIINEQLTQDDSPNYAGFRAELDKIAISQIVDNSRFPYQYHISAEQENTHNNVAQFSEHTYSYSGGAHGLGSVFYLPIDMTLKRPLELKEVLNDKQNEFYNLAEQSFLDYLSLIDVTTPEEIADYLQVWPFEMTDNFYFGEEGIVLVYQPYEMGAYVHGNIELTVPYSKLQSLLKPQYLP